MTPHLLFDDFAPSPTLPLSPIAILCTITRCCNIIPQLNPCLLLSRQLILLFCVESTGFLLSLYQKVLVCFELSTYLMVLAGNLSLGVLFYRDFVLDVKLHLDQKWSWWGVLGFSFDEGIVLQSAMFSFLLLIIPRLFTLQ